MAARGAPPRGGGRAYLVLTASTATLVETPASIVFDEVSTHSLTASAYAPTPAFSLTVICT